MINRFKNIDYLHGNIMKTLLKASIPSIISMTLHTFYNIINGIFLGNMVGKQALTAITLIFPIGFIIFAIGNGITVGASASVSKCLGAKDINKANIIAVQSFWLLIFKAILITVVLYFNLEFIFRAFGATGEVLEMILTYMKIDIMGYILIYYSIIHYSMLRAEGNVIVPMFILLSGTLINIILDPILIGGFWFIQPMGIKGAAIATLIARITGCICLVFYFFQRESFFKVLSFKSNFDFKIIKTIYRVGLPMTVAQLIMGFNIIFINWLLSSFGDDAIAAYGVCNRLESLAIMPVLAINIGVVPMIGQNYGANNFRRIKDITKASTINGGFFMLFVGLLFIVIPEFWIKLFNPDINIIGISKMYLYTVCPVYFFVGVSILIGGTFMGLGKGNPIMYLTLFRLILMFVPLAFLLTPFLGLEGIWLSLLIASFLSWILSMYMLRNEFAKPNFLNS